MDDDDVQESTAASDTAPVATPTKQTATPKPAATQVESASTQADTESAPAKPPRPMTEAQKNVSTLKEAFPTVDDAVIKAVLTASGGKVEPAFHALLGKSNLE